MWYKWSKLSNPSRNQCNAFRATPNKFCRKHTYLWMPRLYLVFEDQSVNNKQQRFSVIHLKEVTYCTRTLENEMSKILAPFNGSYFRNSLLFGELLLFCDHCTSFNTKSEIHHNLQSIIIGLEITYCKLSAKSSHPMNVLVPYSKYVWQGAR